MCANLELPDAPASGTWLGFQDSCRYYVVLSPATNQAGKFIFAHPIAEKDTWEKDTWYIGFDTSDAFRNAGVRWHVCG